MKRPVATTALVGLAVVLQAASPAHAQQPATLNIIVGFGAGGLYHNTGVILSRHMGKYLPGNPTIVVRPMPGAGSVVAANHIANVAPKDGSTLAIIGGNTILESLFGSATAQYDPRTLRWIGSMSTAVNLCTVWHTTPVKSLDDMRQHELVAGSTGRGSRTWDYPTALNTLLGTRFKVISGYTGLPQMHPAIENGEIQSICGWGWDGIMAQRPDWLRDNKVRILVQMGYQKHPNLPDVPLILDLLKTERERLAMRMIVLDTLVAWPLVAPPGTPDAKVAELRAAFVKAMADPGVLEDTRKAARSSDMVTGEAIEKAIADVYATPADVVAFAKKLLDHK
jgi:tripartite-type tricarboxylate transporter receptor subunit TctC